MGKLIELEAWRRKRQEKLAAKAKAKVQKAIDAFDAGDTKPKFGASPTATEAMKIHQAKLNDYFASLLKNFPKPASGMSMLTPSRKGKSVLPQFMPNIGIDPGKGDETTVAWVDELHGVPRIKIPYGGPEGSTITFSPNPATKKQLEDLDKMREAMIRSMSVDDQIIRQPINVLLERQRVINDHMNILMKDYVDRINKTTQTAIIGRKKDKS